MDARISQGAPEPLGLTLDADGANVAVFSEHAEAIELCLFDENGVHRFHERPAEQSLIIKNRTKDLGLFLQDHRWTIDEGAATPQS